jgi:uncharacterized RDD family membrane protein YckC
MLGVMNAIAHASRTPVSGSKLDNRRVIAAIVDLLIVTAGAVVVLVAGDSLGGDRQGALGAVILGWALYYFFALESGEGQTIGKRLMKLRVMRADGRPAGMREIGVRTILRVIDNYLVGLIVMLATGERRQRIGDLAAGTIVVDAAGLAVAPPAPVADAVEEDADADEPELEAEAEPEPVATETITLPARPTPPETLSDLTEPEAEEDVAEEDVAVEDAAEEPAAAAPAILEPRPVPLVEKPVVQDEPVVEAPPVPVEPNVEVQDDLPEVTSPSLEELAEDVAAAHVEPEVEEADELPEDDGPVNVKSVETVSAMDLIMGAAEEDNASEGGSEHAEDSASS